MRPEQSRIMSDGGDERVDRSPISNTVDIIPFIERFSDIEKSCLLDNLVAIELTDGCSSGCGDCYLEVNHVPAEEQTRISYSSLENFFDKYHKYLTKNFLLFYGSEFFDWKDGDRRGIHLYKLFRKYFPDSRFEVSTYLPEGKDEEIAEVLGEMLIDSKKDSHNIFHVSLRSPTENGRQKEAMKIRLRMGGILKTIENSNPDLDRSEFLKVVKFDYPDEIRLPIGKTYGRGGEMDIFRDIQQFVECRDGVVLTTKGFIGITMDAISDYAKGGVTKWPINPGRDFKIPVYLLDHWPYYFQKQYLSDFFPGMEKYYIFPEIEVMVNKMNGLERQRVFSLSREMMSFRWFISSYTHLVYTDNNPEKMFYDYSSGVFLRAKEEYSRRSARVKEFISSGSLDPKDKYFLPIAQNYLRIMDFLFEYCSKFDRDEQTSLSQMKKAFIIINSWTGDQVSDPQFDMAKDIEEST